MQTSYAEDYITAVKFVFLFLIMILADFSYAQNRCFINQITNTTSSANVAVSLNASGTLLAFASDANLVNENPEGNREIFLYDSTTNSITQITFEISGMSNVPFINADGSRIAYTFEEVLGNQQVFLYDANTDSFTQITNEPTGDSNGSSISSDGMLVGFVSTSDINSGNSEGNREAYFFNTDTNMITQITSTTAGLSEPALISGNGMTIAFSSSANIGGDNTEGNFELYLYNVNTGITTQITNFTTGDIFTGAINQDGTRIAITSNANINGLNPDANFGIYLYDVITDTFTQIVSLSSGDSFLPAINATGSRIPFVSRANINGQNPEGNREVYYFDTIENRITQLTRQLMGSSTEPSINADGSLIAFQSEANINNGNQDENWEIYLANCPVISTATQIPTLSEWGLIALAAILGIVGFMVIRRRKVSA